MCLWRIYSSGDRNGRPYKAVVTIKKSVEFDIVCVKRVLKYIQNIRDAYRTYKIGHSRELAGNELCHLAITQIIINLYETKTKMTQETLARIPRFDRIRLKTARNIASHDYDSLDFDIVYRITMQLVSKEVIEELEAVLNDSN